MQQKHICKTYKAPFNCNVMTGLSHTKYTTWRKKPERRDGERKKKIEGRDYWGMQKARYFVVLTNALLLHPCQKWLPILICVIPHRIFQKKVRKKLINFWKNCLATKQQRSLLGDFFGFAYFVFWLAHFFIGMAYLMSLTLGWSILYEMDNLGCIDGESSIFICLFSLIKPCSKQSCLPSLWKKDCRLEKVYIPPWVVTVIFLPALTMCTKRRKIRILNVTMCLVRPKN